jgi:methionine synthase II (cobalamin-independent)
MNIKQALKEKNKLAKKVTDLMDRTNRNNSMDEGAVRSYDPKESLEQALQMVDDLVNLKTKMHMANSEVYDKIFRMSEYKSLVKYLKTLNCSQGTIVTSRYGDSTTRQMTTVITEVERDALVEKYETLIDNLQTELDTHNATTQI